MHRPYGPCHKQRRVTLWFVQTTPFGGIGNGMAFPLGRLSFAIKTAINGFGEYGLHPPACSSSHRHGLRSWSAVRIALPHVDIRFPRLFQFPKFHNDYDGWPYTENVNQTMK